MKSKNVVVCGYFGYESNQLDGQTVKTRNVFKLLKSKQPVYFNSVTYFDTQKFQTKKLSILDLFLKIARTNIFVYLPAHNNFRYLFPLVFIISWFFRTKIHYIVVGGWLAGVLKNKLLHRWMLSRISGIYPETQQLIRDLQRNFEFKNVYQLQNFRFVDRGVFGKERSDIVRLVFMARVHPLKGIRTIFKLADQLIAENILNVKIDIYGPIFPEYSNEFKKVLNRHTNVNYIGVLEPDRINHALMKYDLMLFPTQYFTEGFPGTILDAYLAYVPVIATQWRYAEEFIEDGYSGIIVDFDDDEGFVKKSLEVILDPIRLKNLRLGAINYSEKYSPESAWNTLLYVIEK